MYVQQQIKRPWLKQLEIAPTILPMMADNAPSAFPASLLSASDCLSNQFFKASLYFDGKPPVLPLPLKAPVIAMIMVEIVLDRQ